MRQAMSELQSARQRLSEAQRGELRARQEAEQVQESRAALELEAAQREERLKKDLEEQLACDGRGV